jgi:hypothetical protein
MEPSSTRLSSVLAVIVREEGFLFESFLDDEKTTRKEHWSLERESKQALSTAAARVTAAFAADGSSSNLRCSSGDDDGDAGLGSIGGGRISRPAV